MLAQGTFSAFQKKVAIGKPILDGNEAGVFEDWSLSSHYAMNNRLHRNLACVIDESSRGAKIKRAFEELPKRATALNGGSHLAKSKERFAGGLPTERSARFGKVSKRRRSGLRKAFSDALFG